VACWFADLQHSEESQAEGGHGLGRRKAAVRDPGAAVAAAAMQPDRKDQQTEAEGPDGLVGAAVAHLH
jgi:hypothetical protein